MKRRILASEAVRFSLVSATATFCCDKRPSLSPQKFQSRLQERVAYHDIRRQHFQHYSSCGKRKQHTPTQQIRTTAVANVTLRAERWYLYTINHPRQFNVIEMCSKRRFSM